MTQNQQHKKIPLVSVVIPTKSRAILLTRCIESLQKQTIKPYEIIIVTWRGESYAHTIKRKFSSLPIRVVTVSTPSYAQTRNKGISVALGDIIALIDDDCTADTSWIKTIIGTHTQPNIVAQGIGYLNALPLNIFSVLHNLRNKEGFMYQLSLSTDTIKIQSQSLPLIHMIDNKNVSFQKALLKQNPKLYATWLPSYVCADDCELANRLNIAHIPIVYNSNIKVFHLGRTDGASLLSRSFEYGRSDRWTAMIGRNALSQLPFSSFDTARIRLMSLQRSIYTHTKITTQTIRALLNQHQFNLNTRFLGIIVYFAMKVVRFVGYLYEKIYSLFHKSPWQQHGAHTKKGHAFKREPFH